MYLRRGCGTRDPAACRALAADGSRRSGGLVGRGRVRGRGHTIAAFAKVPRRKIEQIVVAVLDTVHGGISLQRFGSGAHGRRDRGDLFRGAAPGQDQVIDALIAQETQEALRVADILGPPVAQRVQVFEPRGQPETCRLLRVTDRARMARCLLEVFADAPQTGIFEFLPAQQAGVVPAAREIEVERSRARPPAGADERIAALEQQLMLLLQYILW